MPWYMEQLIQGNPVVMNRVEDLPPEAEKERQLCLAQRHEIASFHPPGKRR